jgi:hypothetical protein
MTHVMFATSGRSHLDGKHHATVPGIYSAGMLRTAASRRHRFQPGAEAAMIIFEDLINPIWFE